MTQLSDFSAGLPLHAAPDLRRGSAAEQLLAAAEPPFNETLSEKMVRLERENAALRERAEDAEKGWRDTLAARGYQGPIERNTHEVLISLAQLAEEQLAVSRHILSALNTPRESRSSVEFDSNGSAGKVKVKIKEYVDQPVDETLTNAAQKFAAAMATVEAAQTNGWATMVNGLAEAKAAGQ